MKMYTITLFLVIGVAFVFKSTVSSRLVIRIVDSTIWIIRSVGTLVFDSKIDDKRCVNYVLVINLPVCVS